MKSYKERFHGILKSTALGCGIGLVGGLIFAFIVTKNHFEILDFIQVTFVMCLTFGLGLSIVLYSKNGVASGMEGWIVSTLTGLFGSIFGFMSGSVVTAMIGIFLLFLSLFVLIPCIVYMVVIYPVNFVYYLFMTILE